MGKIPYVRNKQRILDAKKRDENILRILDNKEQYPSGFDLLYNIALNFVSEVNVEIFDNELLNDAINNNDYDDYEDVEST